jgi:hypothetical protein
MPTATTDKPYRIGYFKTVAQADQAVRSLLTAGFTRDELAVIVPDRFKGEFHPDIKPAERPGSHGAAAIVEGGVAGMALGGLALVAAVVGTGGAALLPAIPVFIGGGALAGAFSSLIASDGYGKGIGEHYEEAVRVGEIVVGVEVEGAHNAALLAEAERLLIDAGADPSLPTRA